MSHNFKGIFITDDEFCNLEPRNIFHREKDKMNIEFNSTSGSISIVKTEVK